MKKFILTIIMLLLTTTAIAQHHGGHHGGHRGGHWARHNSGWMWVVPAIIGGAIVYEATRPPVVVQQPPVIVQQPPVVLQGQCSPWTEIMNPDGTITRTRTCTY